MNTQQETKPLEHCFLTKTSFTFQHDSLQDELLEDKKLVEKINKFTRRLK